MRTAFSDVPRKWVIFKVCLTHRKNSSIAHRRLYRSAISCALAVRSWVKMRNTLPVSIVTRTSRTRPAIGLRREAASRLGNWPILNDLKGRIALHPRDDAAPGLIERCPPPVIVIAEVENIGSSRLDRH